MMLHEQPAIRDFLEYETESRWTNDGFTFDDIGKRISARHDRHVTDNSDDMLADFHSCVGPIWQTSEVVQNFLRCRTQRRRDGSPERRFRMIAIEDTCGVVTVVGRGPGLDGRLHVVPRIRVRHLK